MKKHYTKKEYNEYVKRLVEDGFDKDCAIGFKDWKYAQPIADMASGLVNDIILKDMFK